RGVEREASAPGRVSSSVPTGAPRASPRRRLSWRQEPSDRHGHLSDPDPEMNVDPVAVVEASYRVDQTPAAWLDGVAHAVAPALDAGAGLIALLVENPRHAAVLPAVVATATVGATDNDLRIALVLRAAATPAGRVPFRAAGPASTLRRTLGAAF